MAQIDNIKALYVERYGNADNFDAWLEGFTSPDEAEEYIEFEVFRKRASDTPPEDSGFANPITF